MKSAGEFNIVAFEERYALETVKMWRASMEHALSIKDTHSWDEQLAYLRHLVQEYSVYLALEAQTSRVVGLVVYGGTELDQLYIHIDYQRRGIGTQLLNLAKSQSPGKLQLYTFEVNKKAQSFYEKHGFEVIRRGVEARSGMADIRYEWIK